MPDRDVGSSSTRQARFAKVFGDGVGLRRRILLGLAGLLVVGGAVVAAAMAGRPSDPVDTHRPGDIEFLSRFSYGGAALELFHYESVEEAADDATAVVVAEVVDVVHAGTFLGETPEDVIEEIGVVLEPVEVLRGELPESDRQRLTVEFIGGSVDPDEAIAEMRQMLPKGHSLWFLRSDADAAQVVVDDAKKAGKSPDPDVVQEASNPPTYYVPVSQQGLFAQGDGHVINPLKYPHDPGGAMVVEAQEYERLSELIAAVRAPR